VADPTRDQLLDAAFVLTNLPDLILERLRRDRLNLVAVAARLGMDHGHLRRIVDRKRGLNATTAAKLITWLGETT
jgi:plasmid maintenance system antidote protein VapI